MIKLGDCMLVNFKQMLNAAGKEKRAVPHFNINNLEWTKYILEECEKLQEPVILGVSESASKYMGGFHTIVGFVKGLIKDLNITIPVCLHLDHGKTFEICKKAIDAGFSSVMIDASKLKLTENIKLTKKVVDYAHKHNVTVEAEIGYIGEQKEKMPDSAIATVEDCLNLYEQTGIDALAPALGNLHGFYEREPNLNFERMKEISSSIFIPLVLHGGSGIPDKQIKKAIQYGINKINVNTELQSAWTQAIRKYIENNQEEYDPRKIIGSGEKAIKKVVLEKIKIFNTSQEENHENN